MKHSKMAQVKKMFIIIILIIVACGVVYRLFFRDINLLGIFMQKKAQTSETTEQQAAGPAPQAEQTVPIKAFVVAQRDYKDYLHQLGTIKGGLEFKLSFEIPGIINTVNYREGEKYDKGALLISLKQDDILLRLRRSEARLKKSKTTEGIYLQKVKEHEKLFSIGAIPQGTLDKIRLEYQGAQAEREEAELQVRADEVILEKSNLYAPSAGMIGELNVEPGEAITSNTLLGTHILTEYVKAEFGVIEKDVTRIKPKQLAFIESDAYPDKVFEGAVERISPIVTGMSRTASAEVRIANPDGFLLPGMFARVKVLLYEKNNAILIPTDAVIEVQGRQAVYLVDEAAKTVRLREVVVEYSKSDFSVIADGLKKDDVIALSPLDQLEADSHVDVLEKQHM